MWNEIRAGEPIRTTQWHDSSFALCNKERVHKIFPEAATISVLKMDAPTDFANFWMPEGLQLYLLETPTVRNF